jgi:hypothetical protein
MKTINIILLITLLFGLGGCYGRLPLKEQSYAFFEENKNLTIGGSLIPEMNQHRREIYSEDRYIYRFETPPKCVFGYLTNKDDKPEKVIGWVILSGKDFCRQQIHGWYHYIKKDGEE